MDALETVLRPVANLLNKNIRDSTPARELCKELSGAVVAIRVRDTALTAYFRVFDDTLDIVASAADEPDVVISGSLMTLARMAGQPGEVAVRAGSLDLTGDATIASQFQRLLSHAKLLQARIIFDGGGFDKPFKGRKSLGAHTSENKFKFT